MALRVGARARGDRGLHLLGARSSHALVAAPPCRAVRDLRPGHRGALTRAARRPLSPTLAQSRAITGGGTIYGMSVKTTLYLPDELKAEVEREARRRGIAEA